MGKKEFQPGDRVAVRFNPGGEKYKGKISCLGAIDEWYGIDLDRGARIRVYGTDGIIRLIPRKKPKAEGKLITREMLLMAWGNIGSTGMRAFDELCEGLGL